MPQFRLNRRAVLRGAGSVAIALPWLEIMTPERPARAAGAPAKRLINVFTPGGTVLDNWRPTGGTDDFQLSPILLPLQAWQSRLLVVDGVDMKSASGEVHQCGLIAWLTGTAQVESGPASKTSWAGGPSIDQVLASQLSNGEPLSSLQLAIRWGTGKGRGVTSPIDIANFADTPTFDPIAPRIDPVKIWNDLFGTPSPTDRSWDQSILDAVGQRYSKLAQRLGSEDRQRLEAHLATIRQIELELQPNTSCTPPPLVDTSDYNPAAGLSAGDPNGSMDPATDAAIPKVGKLMIDMMVMAMACDLTSVATLLWSDVEAKFTLPWLGLDETLSFYMRDGGYHPDELTKIFTWYATQHAYLLERLAQVAVGGGTLLDETLLFFGSNLQNPQDYARTDMPFLLAGSGGGLRTNRWVQGGHASHNDLLVSILNLCGDDRASFGDPKYCSGPLLGLT